MIRFTNHTMQALLPIIQKQLTSEVHISFEVLDCDKFDDLYAGTIVSIDGVEYIYRSLKAWMDLAELLHCKMSIPKRTQTPYILITYTKIQTKSFHDECKQTEKYGSCSTFSQIHKMEEPAFYYYYQQALANVQVAKKKSVLNLGVNRADEFDVIMNILDKDKQAQIELVGIDHSKSAIEIASVKYKDKQASFYAHDINDIDSLKLGKFDLLMSIGTLQSPSIDFKPFFMKLVQTYLSQDAAIILGFPNSRWIGNEMIYGAKAPNYRMSEMSLVLNDIMFCKKYLQQKKFRVTITGKYYLFLTATKIGVNT